LSHSSATWLPLLWLVGAYEGLASAAVILLKHDSSDLPMVQRNSSMFSLRHGLSAAGTAATRGACVVVVSVVVTCVVVVFTASWTVCCRHRCCERCLCSSCQCSSYMCRSCFHGVMDCLLPAPRP